MRYIIFSNDEQTFAEAKKIFEKNHKIKNIPVVDQSKKLLFQIDRYEQMESIENSILNAIRSGSIKYFLQAADTEKIIFTGAANTCLQKAKILLEKHLKNLDLRKEVLVEFVDDVRECPFGTLGSRIICLNDIGSFYINHYTNFRANIVSVKEFTTFIEFSKIAKLDTGVINNWKKIFDYEKIVFCSSNQYISQLEYMIKNCGVQVCYINTHMVMKSNIDADFLFPLDVLLFSKHGTYCEKFSLIELIQVFELLWYYRKISGQNLTVERYYESSIKCLSALQEEGINGVLFKTNSIWKEKLSSKIREECTIEVKNAGENRLSGEKYLVDNANISEAIKGDYICNVTDRFLRYICEYIVYEKVCEICKNVYICPAQQHVFDEFAVYPERNRYNFLYHKDRFPNNFVREICGHEGYSLTTVIEDMQNCETVKINDGYMKFLSNYRSQYFNTDTYGSRIVIGAPNEYLRTIWLVGACNFMGYAVEDKDTTASVLQKKIKESDYPYRVVDLSCDAATSFTLYSKIMDRNIENDDIVIILEHSFILKEKEINIDYREISNTLGKEIWYWDSVGHPGAAGYEIFANKIFDMIKPDLVMNRKVKDTFHVERTLTLSIQTFIADLKWTLQNNVNYKKICQNINLNGNFNRSKVGAIVMNCNPFTYGHQYLVDTASRLVDLLYVFVVEENKSIFSFKERFNMVQAGTRQYENVIVIPSGKFMISTITFPGYFLKDSPTRKCYDTFLDLKIFAHYIAPALEIGIRFVGEEPLDKVTAQYNCDMKIILGDAGINVVEIPRKKYKGEVISASKVRKLLAQKNYKALKEYVPDTSLKYIANIQL